MATCCGADYTDAQIDAWFAQADAAYYPEKVMASLGYRGDPPLTEVVDGMRVPLPPRTIGYARAEQRALALLTDALEGQRVEVLTGVDVVLSPTTIRRVGLLVMTDEDAADPLRKYQVPEEVACAIELQSPGHHGAQRRDLDSLLADYDTNQISYILFDPRGPVAGDALDTIRRHVAERRAARQAVPR